MKALITGASSGIGRDMARVLSGMGYDIIAVARRKERLIELQNELKTSVEILCADITDTEQCKAVAERAKDVDVFINNAGFGVYGDLCSSGLEEEIAMLDTNVVALHILTKAVAKAFKEKGRGHILNVASIAAFFPGPLFGAYYASKAYVLRLSQALAEELRQSKSRVSVSVLCPGPVHTEFERIAKVNFGTGIEKGGNLVILPSRYVAEYAIKKMFAGKTVIIPGKLMKLAVFCRHFVSDKMLARIVYAIQSRKFSLN